MLPSSSTCRPVDEDLGVGPPVLCVPMGRRKGQSPRCQTRITPLREVYAKAYAQKYHPLPPNSVNSVISTV